MRRIVGKYLPAHLHNPVGLAVRLLKNGNAAARLAILSAGLGAVSTPCDLVLSRYEKRRYARSEARRMPILFICGPPRSGTTLVYQTLAKHLPLAYLTNITSIFPRSPLTISRLLRRFQKTPTESYDSFYGKTKHWSGTNDALYLWDRWFGADRSQIPENLPEEQQAEMKQFFAACEQLFQKPLLNKNNSLNLSAHLVGDCLENTFFVCLTRSRFELAKSLYRARCDIHGSPHVPYGASDHAVTNSQDDPVLSICKRVLYYEKIHALQQQRLGEERFWTIRYEEFCQNPSHLIRRVAVEILGDEAAVQEPLPSPFTVSQKKNVSPEIEERITKTFEELDANIPETQ